MLIMSMNHAVAKFDLHVISCLIKGSFTFKLMAINHFGQPLELLINANDIDSIITITVEKKKNPSVLECCPLRLKTREESVKEV